jgi:hypothetical protein
MLHKLLQQNRKFSPVYGRSRLANHMSMSLTAMHKMGATDKQLQQLYDMHLIKLVPLFSDDLSADITEDNWSEYLGQSKYYQAYMLFFKDVIEKNKVETILKIYLPLLVKGISSQGFHCIIRLAYGVDIQDVDEIAVSLAYFSSEYIQLRNIDGKTNHISDAGKVIDKIQTLQSFNFSNNKFNTIKDRLLSVVAQPQFEIINDDLSASIIDLNLCASIVSRIYASAKDFTALHMVTATHALRLLAPYFSDFSEASRYYWQAICAAYIAIGSPDFNNANESHLSSNSSFIWNDIFKKAASSFDDHIIKLVYTCYEENKIYSNKIYQSLAEMAVAAK